MTHLIPPHGRRFFFGVVESQLIHFPCIGKGAPVDESIFELETLAETLSNQSIAALDWGLGFESARTLIAESALAGSLAVQHGQEPDPRDQLKPFFGFGVVGDGAAPIAYAKTILRIGAETKRSEDLVAQALACSIAASFVGNEKLLKHWLSEATKAAAEVRKPKSRAGWAASMTELAKITLTGNPVDLTAVLLRVADDTKAWLGRITDVEDLVFESYLARFPLAFAARAKARGFDLPNGDPHPSMPMALLKLEPKKMPSHSIDAFPNATTEFRKALADALAVESSVPVKRKR